MIRPPQSIAEGEQSCVRCNGGPTHGVPLRGGKCHQCWLDEYAKPDSVEINIYVDGPGGHYTRLKAWLVEQYGEKVGTFLANRFASDLRGCACIDNIRVCDMAVPSEVAAYEKARSNGCCGFSDRELHYFKTGQRFMIGFNHGH